ncbi:MAG: quinone-dependent dihydroorotate dehydrogenase [Ferruginibacter sp.]
MYKVLRNILFLFDPEWVHYFSMNVLKILCRSDWICNLIKERFIPKNDPYLLFNIEFRNRVGLGAGFDKNAKYLHELAALGFGFVEIGTVTPLPQAGNKRPRLFRLPKDKALINRMGFNNEGVEIISETLKAWKDRQYEQPQTSNFKPQTLIIGGNIGKNKNTPNEDAWKDYESCFVAMHDLVDYFVVNVSSPNTPGLRELQEKNSLNKILTNLQSLNNKRADPKPILLKIAPDLSYKHLDDVIELAMEIKLDGFVATNTTIDRSGLQISSQLRSEHIGAGGISGLPVKDRSTEVIKYITGRAKGIPVIASGGIFTGIDAKEKLDAGASLVQIWTGFIYEGPGIVKNISSYLAKDKDENHKNH